MIILPTFGYDYVDDMMITVHKDVDPTQEDWSRMLTDLKVKARELRSSLVLAGSIKLTARQRKELADTVGGSKLKVAVMTESAVTRGILRAIGWLGGPTNVRPFAMKDLGGALDFLEIREPRRRRVEVAIDALRAGLAEANSRSASLP